MTHKQAAEFKAMKDTILVMADQLAILISVVKHLQARAEPATACPPDEVT